MGAAYLGAFALRLDFAEPQCGWRVAAWSFLTVWLVQAASLCLFGCYRLACRRTSLLDLPRYVAAVGFSTAALLLSRFLLPSSGQAAFRPPYSITLINAVLLLGGLFGVRVLWRLYKSSKPDVAALLNRDETYPDSADVVSLLRGACVMVTGAGGSIGRELVRQVVRSGPRLVLLVERGENALYEIDREIRQLGTDVKCLPQMVDITDERRMREMFSAYRPEIVLHAAAYKHVPMVEANPREGIRNNTIATRRLGEMARDAGVRRFVMISTDKAVNPVGVMGVTKRLAEVLLMDLNETSSALSSSDSSRPATLFSAVRFGNVIGSSGSVVPLFREQIAAHLPVTVTHPDMKRYFMTVREAVGLVLEAAALAKGGEVFVLDMGSPVRIVDLAEQLIRQAGYRPYVDIPIRFTGIRPGEKLFEELDISERSAIRTGHARIFVCRHASGDAAAVGGLVAELAGSGLPDDEIRRRLMEAV